jgi:hypothetical protein
MFYSIDQKYKFNSTTSYLNIEIKIKYEKNTRFDVVEIISFISLKEAKYEEQ